MRGGWSPASTPTACRAQPVYYDCQVDYPERLVTEVALAARAAGAVVLNHARVDQLLVELDAVTGVTFTDTVDRHAVEGGRPGRGERGRARGWTGCSAPSTSSPARR